MNGHRIGAALRRTVRERAASCCEYCGIHEDDANLPHEPDHVIARQHGGATTLENLAFACFHCNRLKGPNIASVDPQTNETVRLFHPRQDAWSGHFRLEGARILPLTGIGRVTVELLQFNSVERLAPRESLFAAGRYPGRRQ